MTREATNTSECLLSVEFDIYGNDGMVKVTYQADGKGKAVTEDGWDEETFEHDIAAEVIAEAAAGDDDGLTTVRDHFSSEVNPSLDDPFLLSDDELSDNELHCTNGDMQELEGLIEALLLIDPMVWGEHDSAEIVIAAETEDEGVCLAEWGEWHTAIDDRTTNMAVDLAEHYGLAGHTYEYNDGNGARQSGYCLSPDSLTVSADKPTASGRAEALERLMIWASQNNYAALQAHLDCIEPALAD